MTVCVILIEIHFLPDLLKIVITKFCLCVVFLAEFMIFSSPGRSPGRAIVLHPASALAAAAKC